MVELLKHAANVTDGERQVSFNKPEQSYPKIEEMFRTQQRKEFSLKEKIGSQCANGFLFNCQAKSPHTVYIHIKLHFSSHINITSNLWILIGQSQLFSCPVFLYNDH